MRVSACLILVGGLMTAQPSLSQEYFGNFRDSLVGEFVEAEPRPKFRLAGEFRFIDPNGLLWSVPAQKEVDGASIPQAFWSFIGGPFSGSYIKASVVHDYYCDTKIRTEHDTHRNFYYGMRAAGVGEWKAKFMYWAVATFGPKWTLTQRVVFDSVCNDIAGQTVCTQAPSVKMESASLPGVDLSDPEILAAALSKASAVARSLRTTEGRILDVTATGQVAASLEDISKSASRYRAVFADKGQIASPAELGVLSQWNAAGLDEVQFWQSKKIPSFGDAVVLKPSTVKSIEEGDPFKLGPESANLLRGRLNLKALESKTSLPDVM